jgi:7-carboxy-7-deazaguanine synthase
LLAINEEFYSIQGEGLHTGIPMYFVRLQGCAVGCYFCDTKYTWRPEDQTTKEGDIINRALNSKADWICLTGGEPLEQDVSQLTQMAKDHGLFIHIETSGAYYQDNIKFDYLCLSPKDLFSKKKALPIMKEHAAEIKVVVTKMSDLDYYLREYYPFCEDHSIPLVIQFVDNNFTLLNKTMEVTQGMKFVRIMMQQHKVMQLR